jgi:hypothetical protein
MNVDIQASGFYVDVLCPIVGYSKKNLALKKPISSLQFVLKLLGLEYSGYFDRTRFINYFLEIREPRDQIFVRRDELVFKLYRFVEFKRQFL